MELTIRHIAVISLLGGLLVLTGCGAPGVARPSNQPSPNATRSVSGSQYLAQFGLDVRPLQATEPVSRHHAIQVAPAAFPNLSTLKSVTAQLVTFSSPHSPALQKPRPAWLVTWHALSYPAGPSTASASPGSAVVFHHMNVVVSAVTGQVLLIFTSP